MLDSLCMLLCCWRHRKRTLGCQSLQLGRRFCLHRRAMRQSSRNHARPRAHFEWTAWRLAGQLFDSNHAFSIRYLGRSTVKEIFFRASECHPTESGATQRAGWQKYPALGEMPPKDLFPREARSTRARSALTDGAKRLTDARSAVASTRAAFLQCFESSRLKIFFAARASRAAERFALVSTPQGRAQLLPPGGRLERSLRR